MYTYYSHYGTLIVSYFVHDTKMFLTGFVMLNGGIAERKIISRRLYWLQ